MNKGNLFWREIYHQPILGLFPHHIFCNSINSIVMYHGWIVNSHWYNTCLESWACPLYSSEQDLVFYLSCLIDGLFYSFRSIMYLVPSCIGFWDVLKDRLAYDGNKTESPQKKLPKGSKSHLKLGSAKTVRSSQLKMPITFLIRIIRNRFKNH